LIAAADLAKASKLALRVFIDDRLERPRGFIFIFPQYFSRP
jgi:hypothetical protein